MRIILFWVARITGSWGLAVSTAAVAARLDGYFWIRTFQTGTIFVGGMALVLVGCLAYLAGLAETPSR